MTKFNSVQQLHLFFPPQILLGPNTGMSGGMPGMMPSAPGKMWDEEDWRETRIGSQQYCSASPKERQREHREENELVFK